MPDTLAVIPARYGSTRFPGKPLADIGGRPMIQWVYNRAAAATTIDNVVVATDDTRIREVVEDFGGRAVMTSSEHATGTDRVAEAVAESNAQLIINLQGDEPLLPPSVIDALVKAVSTQNADMGTVAVPFSQTSESPDNPNAVKVVTDKDGYALYFSRASIPFRREHGIAVEPLWHWGLYAYTRAFLEQIVQWPQGALEKCEMLEQLRVLENGHRILVVTTTAQSMPVDMPEDVNKVEQALRDRGEI